MVVMEAMLDKGLQTSLSDAGVGILCAKTAVTGAYFNVRINARDLKNKDVAQDLLAKSKKIYEEAIEKETRAIALINSKM